MDNETTTSSRSMVDSRPWGRRGCSVAWEVVVIAQRERGEVVGVLTIGASWSQSYSDSHTTTLNRVVRWCFDREMVLGVRMID
jgi:hypothetical protein